MHHLELVQAFLQTNSFLWNKDKPFKLSSGRESVFYVNCKGVLSHPRYRILIARLVCEKIKDVLDKVDVVGGMEIGAIPIASAISDYYFQHTQPSRELRTFVVRKNPKEHGL